MSQLEVKQPVRGINDGGKSVGINKSNKLSLGATSKGGGLALANEFTAGSRLSGRPKQPQKPRQAKGRRGSVATPVALRTTPRTIVP